MSEPRSRTVSEPSALVGGRAAFVLTAVFERHDLLRRQLADIGFSEHDQAAALEAAGALAMAGEGWRRSRLPKPGNAETRGNEESVASDVMLTVDEAGVLLGLGPRRVRQLAAAGDVPADRTPSGWRFAHRDVVGLRDRRAGQAA